MVNQIIKFVFALPIVIVLLITIIVNVRLHSVSVSPASDLILELQGLKRSLDSHADAGMQKLYPEGYVFFNALYGLSWCNYLTHFAHNDSTAAHGEIQRAVDNVNSENGRAVFDRDLPIPYGAFYTGWSTYLLGKKLSVENPAGRTAAEIELFKQQCDIIAKGIETNTFPVSYPGRAWPADAVLCVSSLALHDRLFEPMYQEAIQQWVVRVKSHLDSNGLIPQEVIPATGKIIEEARGSSQSLMLAFLHEIDDEFFRDQFVRYKEHFFDSRIGLIGIREYPPGRYGLGDVDSGPVVLQMGASATIVGLYPIGYTGDAATVKLYREIEAVGMARHVGNEKNYLLGMLPMADAFIAWSHSASSRLNMSSSNFTTFHLYSLAICFLCVGILWFFWGKRNKTTLHIPW